MSKAGKDIPSSCSEAEVRTVPAHDVSVSWHRLVGWCGGWFHDDVISQWTRTVGHFSSLKPTKPARSPGGWEPASPRNWAHDSGSWCELTLLGVCAVCLLTRFGSVVCESMTWCYSVLLSVGSFWGVLSQTLLFPSEMDEDALRY